MLESKKAQYRGLYLIYLAKIKFIYLSNHVMLFSCILSCRALLVFEFKSNGNLKKNESMPKVRKKYWLYGQSIRKFHLQDDNEKEGRNRKKIMKLRMLILI